jgi:hypothetical protein
VADQADKKTIPNDIQKAIIEVSQTASGQELFRWLGGQCNFYTSSIVGDPSSHEVMVYGTLFNEARRRLYLDVRRFIPQAIRRKIEN